MGKQTTQAKEVYSGPLKVICQFSRGGISKTRVKFISSHWLLIVVSFDLSIVSPNQVLGW